MALHGHTPPQRKRIRAKKRQDTVAGRATKRQNTRQIVRKPAVRRR